MSAATVEVYNDLRGTLVHGAAESHRREVFHRAVPIISSHFGSLGASCPRWSVRLLTNSIREAVWTESMEVDEDVGWRGILCRRKACSLPPGRRQPIA
jgi:hypothetical protein